MNSNIEKNINSKVWDKLFSSKSWGKYPSIQLVKFIASKYYNMKDRSSINILEIGCGPGGNLWYLAREGFKVSGIDFSEVACNQLVGRFESDSLSSQIDKLIVGDYSSAIDSFMPDYFDAVVDVKSLYCNSFDKTKNIINQLANKLKIGGYIYSQTFAKESWGFDESVEEHSYHEIIPREGPMANTGLCRYTTRDDIDHLYQNSSLQIEKIEKQVLYLENAKSISEWIIISKKIK